MDALIRLLERARQRHAAALVPRMRMSDASTRELIARFVQLIASLRGRASSPRAREFAA